MAGRHGVPTPERKTHARQASGERRARARRRDAAQPWGLWLLVRGLLALVVVAAVTWSAILVQQGRGGIWPLVAVAAGVLSLLMLALDVRARRRQRARWRAEQPVEPEPTAELEPEPEPVEFVPEPPPPPRRHSHRK
jgi:hypothetical protein